MNSSVLWSDVVPEKDGIKSAINDITISPDGSRVVAAVGNRVLLYDGETGNLIESLRGHKETVYSVDFSHDGSRFASGGADNVVVIWKYSGQGLLKYTHSSPIHRVKYSPTAIKLASCSESDFGLWTPEQTKVLKEKVTSRIISAAWMTDGSAIAFGTITGIISIRNHNAEEICRIERKAPVWCLLFIPGTTVTNKLTSLSSTQLENSDILVSGCWQKTLAFYKPQNGTYKIHNEKQIGFYPCAISLLGSQSSKSSYLVVSGSHKKATMFSKEGVRLTDLSKKDAWIWGCACSPLGDRLVIGSDSGSIDTLHMDFVSVHALYRDRYAYRENLTEIIVHHLIQDRKVRIKCKDLIRHISLYKNKLAVHLTDRVCIYESSTEDSTDMHFRVRKERMTLRPTVDNAGCDRMAVTTLYVLFCTGNVIESYAFDGVRQRVWMLDSPVSYMKVDGGPDGKEGVLIGLENGSLQKIYVQNPFPVELYKCKKAVISADLSFDRSLLATVDAAATLTVTNVKTQDVLLTVNGVSSVCFNTEVANMICYSSEKSIYVVSGIGSTIVKSDGSITLAPLDPQEQYISGQAIGFQGQRIYCLHRGSITSIDVPQVKYMLKALDNNNPHQAYSTACLGVTESDWKMLAIRSLRANCMPVAKNAFSRLKDMKFLSLIEQVERHHASHDHKKQTPSSSQLSSLDAMWNAELLAYEGHYSEAAKSYARINKIDDAIRIFTDMRMYDDAIALTRNSNKKDDNVVNDLLMKQAQWLKETKDWKGSSDLYIALGNHYQAAKVIIDAASDSNIWQSALIEVVRSTPSDNIEALQYCGQFFTDAKEDAYARETYLKLGDVSKLMTLYINRQLWEEAAKLADDHVGKFDAAVFLPYAEWLVSKDRFVDAMSAFNKADRHDLSMNLLKELTKCAITECRFKDASYYYWMLSKESDHRHQDDSSQYILSADLYYAYATIHSYVTDPFTSHQPETLFQTARFIMNSLGTSDISPMGISKASTLYTLARQSMILGTYKLARLAFDKLFKLQLPDRKQDEIELDMMIIQAKPVRDNTDYLPVCYRCGATNPLLNPFSGKFSKADVCTNCGHPFIRSFISFEVLPLVEFVPDPNITDDDAIELIRQNRHDKAGMKSNWKEEREGDADVYRLDGEQDDDDGRNNMIDKHDLFAKALNKTLTRQNNEYIPVTADANTLLSMQRNEIYVCRPSSANKRSTFYKNMLPEIQIAISQPCHRFFHLEDFEFSYLSNKGCPYSRAKSVGEYGSL